MAKLLDSGQRRDFKSGAVRDLADGKGRCDLLPLNILAMLVSLEFGPNAGTVLNHLDTFMKTGDVQFVLLALTAFHRCDLIGGILGGSMQYEDGMQKYGERNWEKGIPCHTYVDSGVRHFLKYLRGDSDEPHDRAFTWNMLCLAHTYLFIPGMNDLPCKEEEPRITFELEGGAERLPEELEKILTDSILFAEIPE